MPVLQSDRAQFHFAFLFLQEEVTHMTKILLFFLVLRLITVQWLKKHDETQKEKSSLFFFFLLSEQHVVKTLQYENEEKKSKASV